jgi:hypothetical protein
MVCVCVCVMFGSLHELIYVCMYSVDLMNVSEHVDSFSVIVFICFVFYLCFVELVLFCFVEVVVFPLFHLQLFNCLICLS